MGSVKKIDLFIVVNIRIYYILNLRDIIVFENLNNIFLKKKKTH